MANTTVHNRVASAATWQAYNFGKVPAIQFGETSESEPPDKMTLYDFIDLIKSTTNPLQYLPTSKRYFKMGLESYGTKEERILGEDIITYNFTERPYLPKALTDRDEFFGQELAIHQTIQIMENLSTQRSPYIITYVGPFGTGKSHLLTVIQEAVSAYSKGAMGKRYTFKIVFPKNGSRGIKLLPFAPVSEDEVQTKPKRGKLYSEDNLSFQLPSAMNVHPLFLLSPEERSDLIQELKKNGKIPEDKNLDFFINGGALDARSSKIIEALCQFYQGDMNKVLENHIQVERFSYKPVNIPSNDSPHAEVRQITSSIAWDKLPKVLRTMPETLVAYNGYLVKANGFAVNMDDIGRGRPSDYDYLLTTAQTGMLTLANPPAHPMLNAEEPLDISFFQTANPEKIIEIINRNRALKERMIIIMVPRERRYQNERKIHQALFNKAAASGRKIAPLTQEVYALWATMTRLLPINANDTAYSKVPEKEKFKELLNKVDLLKKALLYQGEDMNGFLTNPKDSRYLSKPDQTLLDQNLALIANEHMKGVGEINYNNYEGAFGVPERDGDKTIIPELLKLHSNQPLSVLDVFEYIGRYLKSDPIWLKEREGFLKERAEELYKTYSYKEKVPTPLELLKSVEDYAKRDLLNKIKATLDVHQPEDERIRTLHVYLEHIRANAFSDDPDNEGKVREGFRYPTHSEKPNTEMMQAIEKVIFNVVGQDNINRERNKILSKNIPWQGSSEEQAKIIKTLFDRELQLLKSHEESKTGEAKLKQFQTDMGLKLTNPQGLEEIAKADLEREKAIRQMHQAIQQLVAQGYPEKLLPEFVDWVFSKEYLSDGSWERKKAS